MTHSLGRSPDEDLPADATTEVPAECAHLPEALKRLYPELEPIYEWVEPHWEDAAWVGNRLAELAPLAPSVKQGLLELDDPLERLRFLAPLIHLGAERSDA